MAVKLRTARMTDQTLVSNIDDYVGELETDLATIFGFTPDVDVTISPFLCNNAGQLTKPLIVWRQPGFDQVLEITNTTNSDVVSVGCSTQTDDLGDVKLFGFFMAAGIGLIHSNETFDRNSSFAGFSLLVGSNVGTDPYWQLLGYTVTAAAQGLVPKASGNAREYLCATGVFRLPGRPGDTAGLSGAMSSGSLNTGLNTGTVYDLYWSTETYDDSALHAANAKGVVLASDGKYLVHAQVEAVPESGLEAGYVRLEICRDRSATVTVWGMETRKGEVSAGVNQIQAEAVIDCLTSDILYARVTQVADSATIDQMGLANGRLHVSRVV